MLKEARPTRFVLEYFGDPIEFGERIEKMPGVRGLNIADPEKSFEISTEAPDRFYEHECFTLDRTRHELLVNGERIHLFPLEHKLLEYFIDKRGEVVEKDQFCIEVWDKTPDKDFHKIIRMNISKLRKKISNDRNVSPIKTVWGLGYSFY